MCEEFQLVGGYVFAIYINIAGSENLNNFV